MMLEISSLSAITSISSAILIAEYGILYERKSVSKWTLALNSLNFLASLLLFLNGSFFHMLLAAFSMAGILVILKNMAEGDQKTWSTLLFGSKTVGAMSFYLGICSLEEVRVPIIRFMEDLIKTLLGTGLDPIVLLTTLLFLTIGTTHVLGFFCSRRKLDGDKLKLEAV